MVFVWLRCNEQASYDQVPQLASNNGTHSTDQLIEVFFFKESMEGKKPN